MDLKTIYYHSLLKDELTYEILIRSETPGSTVQEMRQQLKKLSFEFLPEEVIGEELQVTSELNIISEKVKELQSKLGTIEKNRDRRLLVRAKALYAHLFYRMFRLGTMGTQADKDNYTALRTKIQQCGVTINALLPSQSNEKESASSHTEETKESTNINVLKYINNKFNGLTSVHAFLEAVEERAQAFGITDDQLFNAACCLFTEQGLLWYRGNKHRFSTWKELGILLKQEFAPVDFDYRLLGEIHARTQGMDEPTHIYFAVMSGMFSRLLNPLDDKQQLQILLHNIRPSFSEQLALQEIDTVESLRQVCRKIEAARQQGKLFTEPPRQSALNPDFAYNGKSNKTEVAGVANTFQQQSRHYKPVPNHEQFQRGNTNQYQRQYNGSAQRFQRHGQHAHAPQFDKSPQQTNTLYCYRCRVNTHDTKACRDKRILCFKCGEPGYTSRSCPKCNKLNQSKN